MSLFLPLETIKEASVVMAALNSLIEKGYTDLNVIEAGQPNAIQAAIDWDTKIDTARNLIIRLENQIATT